MGNIINLKDAKAADGYERILLMGDSGTGKTRFVGTMPAPFVADFDAGTSTLAGLDVKAMEFTPDAEGWKAFKAELETWRKQGPQYDCKTFALDSITMAADAALQWVLAKNGRSEASITIADWGEAIREVKTVLGKITTLRCHSVVTAHLMAERDELRGEIRWLPLMYGKDLPGRTPIYFNSVFMTTVNTAPQGGKMVTTYRMQVKPDARYTMLKSRMDRDSTKFDLFEAPDFNHLVAKANK